MRTPRFYTKQTLNEDQSILLDQAPSHHLVKVLRSKPGLELLLFNGDGKEYRAVFEQEENRLARVYISDSREPQRESDLKVHLGQGISRGERMDLVMQKSVELGVQTITPLWTSRSQVQLSGKRLEKRLSHWRGIVTSACEQSGRVELPDLQACSNIRDWISTGTGEDTGIILDPGATQTLKDIEPTQRARVLIGPEGGFDDEEIESASAAGFQRVRLGPRVLRTETATLATLTAIQLLWGDLGEA